MILYTLYIDADSVEMCSAFLFMYCKEDSLSKKTIFPYAICLLLLKIQ